MKQGLYLETSVIGAYLDNGEPFRSRLDDQVVGARNARLPHGDFTVGNFRAWSIEEPHRELVPEVDQQSIALISRKRRRFSRRATSRAASFIASYIADALHVAIASFHKIDDLVTWNFDHLANVRRQARIRLFNTAAGFYVPMIVTPEFLVVRANGEGY